MTTPISNVSIAFFAVAVLSLCASACTPFMGPFKTGALFAETQRKIGEKFIVKYRLRNVDGGGYKLFVWCSSSNTTDLALAMQLGENHRKAAFVDRGWSLLAGAHLEAFGPANEIEKLADHMVVYVAGDVLIVNPDNPGVTFDACKTSNSVDTFNRLAPYIESKEISWAHSAVVWERPQLLLNFQMNSDFVSGCLEVNSKYVVNKSARYEICTKNAGKSWYAEKFPI